MPLGRAPPKYPPHLNGARGRCGDAGRLPWRAAGERGRWAFHNQFLFDLAFFLRFSKSDAAIPFIIFDVFLFLSNFESILAFFLLVRTVLLLILFFSFYLDIKFAKYLRSKLSTCCFGNV